MATFRIYLPLIDGAEVQLTPGETPASLVEGSETVLLVEDEALVRDLAVRTLQSQGYRVLEAANGAEALRVAQEHPGGEIDLLLTDMVMPQMGGRELAERLRAVHPCIKVLFTSGYTDEAIGRHGILAPGVEFMQKPFSLTTLALKVRGVLDSSGYGPPAILTRREGL